MDTIDTLSHIFGLMALLLAVFGLPVVVWLALLCWLVGVAQDDTMSEEEEENIIRQLLVIEASFANFD